MSTVGNLPEAGPLLCSFLAEKGIGVEASKVYGLIRISVLLLCGDGASKARTKGINACPPAVQQGGGTLLSRFSKRICGGFSGVVELMICRHGRMGGGWRVGHAGPPRLSDQRRRLFAFPHPGGLGAWRDQLATQRAPRPNHFVIPSQLHYTVRQPPPACDCCATSPLPSQIPLSHKLPYNQSRSTYLANFKHPA
jgi:hypothetical protein